MIYTVTLNPSIDRTLFVDSLVISDTNRVKRIEMDIGGKGVNTARVLAALEQPAAASGFIAGKNGYFVKSSLEYEGVECRFIQVEGETRINISIEELAQDKPPTTFNEQGPEISESAWNELLEQLDYAAQNAEWFTFGGSLPPGVPKAAYSIMLDIVKKHGAKVVLDADGAALATALDKTPYMIKPNKKEAERLLNIQLTTDDAFMNAALELHKTIPLVVISRGKEGAVIAYGNQVYKGTPPVVSTQSTIGAGDSMVAGIIHGIIKYNCIEQALIWGCAAGSATAMTNGAEIANKNQIEALVPGVVVEKLK